MMLGTTNIKLFFIFCFLDGISCFIQWVCNRPLLYVGLISASALLIPFSFCTHENHICLPLCCKFVTYYISIPRRYTFLNPRAGIKILSALIPEDGKASSIPKIYVSLWNFDTAIAEGRATCPSRTEACFIMPNEFSQENWSFLFRLCPCIHGKLPTTTHCKSTQIFQLPEQLEVMLLSVKQTTISFHSTIVNTEIFHTEIPYNFWNIFWNQ